MHVSWPLVALLGSGLLSALLGAICFYFQGRYRYFQSEYQRAIERGNDLRAELQRTQQLMAEAGRYAQEELDRCKNTVRSLDADGHLQDAYIVQLVEALQRRDPLAAAAMVSGRLRRELQSTAVPETADDSPTTPNVVRPPSPKG